MIEALQKVLNFNDFSEVLLSSISNVSLMLSWVRDIVFIFCLYNFCCNLP